MQVYLDVYPDAGNVHEGAIAERSLGHDAPLTVLICTSPAIYGRCCCNADSSIILRVQELAMRKVDVACHHGTDIICSCRSQNSPMRLSGEPSAVH